MSALSLHSQPLSYTASTKAGSKEDIIKEFSVVVVLSRHEGFAVLCYYSFPCTMEPSVKAAP